MDGRWAGWALAVPVILLASACLPMLHDGGLSGFGGFALAPSAPRSGSPHGGLEPELAGAPCAVARCLPGAPAHPVQPTPAVRVRALGTTPTNWLVANWSGEGMIAENPTNPANIVVGSLYQAASTYNNTTGYYQGGDSGAFASFDGGRTWADQTLPPMAEWSNSSSTMCGLIHIADSAVAFGPNNTVYYVDLAYSGASSYYSCTTSPGGYEMQVSSSPDGGRTWNPPVSLSSGYVGSVDKPWIAVDPVSGEVYVAYTDDGSGSQIWLQSSNDSGATWSKQVLVSGSSTDSLRGVELAVDPGRAVDAVWVDQSTAAVEFARSTDFGAKFSAPKTIAVGLSASADPSPDGFRAYLLPGLGVDAYAGNAYSGRIFAVWQNGTGANAGDPKVSLSYSNDNGSKWTAPTTVNSDKKLKDFQPDVAVGPDGTVYVEWYAVNATSGHYNLLGAVSHNGGAHFDPEFRISDTDSYPHYAYNGNAWWIGDYTDILTDPNGARPLWTDARATQAWACSPCLWSYDYNISMYTALIVNVSLTSNVPVSIGVNGTVQPNGSRTIGPAPSYGDWLAGASYSLRAPPTASDNGTTRYFATWYGSNYTSSEYLNGTLAHGASWHACYVDVPGEPCHAPGAPGYLSVTASPSNARVWVDGTEVVLSNGTVNVTLSPGTHRVNLSAVDYFSSNESANVTPGNLTRLSVAMVGYPGTIFGTVYPAKAAVRVDGTRIVVQPNGSFSYSAPFGGHTVNASLYGYFGYSNASVRVPANASVFLRILLTQELGRLHGNVTPANATISVNGIVVNATGGSFSVVRPYGTYWVNASAAGYDPTSSGAVSLPPLGQADVELALNRSTGFLFGTVYPLGAQLAIAGLTLPVSLGSFEATIATGNYTLNASAPGYVPRNYSVEIASGTGTQLAISLRVSPSWISGTVEPASATLTLDGAPVSVSAAGAFNMTVDGRLHTLVAAADGFDTNTTSVRAEPGHAAHVAIVLGRTAATPSSSAVELGFGAGIAVAVAAAAGAVVVFRRRRRR